MRFPRFLPGAFPPIENFNDQDADDQIEYLKLAHENQKQFLTLTAGTAALFSGILTAVDKTGMLHFWPRMGVAFFVGALVCSFALMDSYATKVALVRRYYARLTTPQHTNDKAFWRSTSLALYCLGVASFAVATLPWFALPA